jgi:hypothetical protein
MKKNYFLLLLAVLFTVSFQAQTVIIDQPDSAGSADFNSLVCFEGNDGIGVYTSDDFVLTSDTILGEIDIYGLLSNTPNFTNLLNFNIYIYADNFGVPNGDPSQSGTGIVELSASPADFTLTEDGTGFANFTVRVTDANGGTQITLPAGTYWLSCAPVVDEPFSTGGTNRWNWNGTTAAVSGVEPVLIDPNDSFGGGFTTWTNIASLIGAPFPGNGFQIRDEAALSVDEFSLEAISLFPNPAQNMLNLKCLHRLAILQLKFIQF